VLFDVPAVPPEAADSGVATTVLSGDVLFAGSIGRYDLSGGDATAMRRTLAEVVLALPDDVLVLPGHGPATSMARERKTNPYLLDLGLVA
jgi:glyoxylase-like metal-dependent hydrolase (beta-lactamase superfamily II)